MYRQNENLIIDMERMSSIFSEFPYVLIVAIAKRIDLFNDFIAFAGVCRLWRSAAIEANKFDIGPSNCSSWPWLMLAENSGAGDDVSCARPFYSLSKGISFKVNLPETKNKRCFASKGWLINIGKTGKDISIDLLHPLSRVQIKLPHLTSSLKYYQPYESYVEEEEEEDIDPNGLLYAQFVHKVVLSSSSSSSAIIMVIYGSSSKLAFCNLGANVVEWIGIKTRPAVYFDVIHYRGHFYAIDCQGRIVVCDVTGTNPTVANIIAKIPKELLRCGKYIEQLYLVESMGKLLVISREGVIFWLINKELINEESNDDYTYRTAGFQIFEFDVRCGFWTDMKNLGDRALFLGHNSSFSIESRVTNGYCWVKPNCIYFTDDYTDSYRSIDGGGGRGGNDMGIYNLHDQSFTPHFNGKSCSPITPPMWIAM